jgi:hypothetical protein
MGQDCIGDHGDRRLDEGRADGQKPNLAFCLNIHNRLMLGGVGSSAPMAELTGATPGWSIGSTGGPTRLLGLHGLASTNLRGEVVPGAAAGCRAAVSRGLRSRAIRLANGHNWPAMLAEQNEGL